MSNAPESLWAEPEPDPLDTSRELAPYQRPGAGTGSGEDNPPGPDDQVRIWTTERLRTFIGTLQPYVDGTFGEVSPRHGALYLRAVAELNRLWNAKYLPPAELEAQPDPEQEQSRAAEASALVRARVLDQLEALRARSRG